jgi:hypothetical protein
MRGLQRAKKGGKAKSNRKKEILGEGGVTRLSASPSSSPHLLLPSSPLLSASLSSINNMYSQR